MRLRRLSALLGEKEGRRRDVHFLVGDGVCGAGVAGVLEGFEARGAEGEAKGAVTFGAASTGSAR